MKYIEVYNFDVLRSLKDGDTDVYIVDKKKRTIDSACGMNVGELLSILDVAEVSEDRYYFYKEVNENE